MGFFTHGFGLFILILAQCLLVTLFVLVSLAFLMYARPQDLGGGADAARAERGRALGAAAVASPTS